MVSKLGPHVILPTTATMEWAKVAPIVKAMDDPAPLLVARPDAIRIFRQSVPNEGDTSNPLGTVAGVIRGLKGYNHPNLYLQLWCGAHPSRANLTLAVVECHRLGYKTVGSSWFTGDYEQSDWDDATSAGVDAYGPQCYWGAVGFSVWHAVRYRSFWRNGQKPVMVLEAGRDKVEGGAGGWQESGIEAAEYQAELLAYGREISKDPYVLGATVFTAGEDKRWTKYGVDGLIPQLINATKENTPVLDLGTGIKNAQQFLGPFTESQAYDMPGTNAETAKAANLNGYAVWCKATNETVVYHHDGRMWRDKGNHGDGSFKVVSGPF